MQNLDIKERKPLITIYSWFGYDLPIKERYRLIKQAGFDGVTIWWDDDFDKIDFRLQPENAHNAGIFIENAISAIIATLLSIVVLLNIPVVILSIQ